MKIFLSAFIFFLTLVNPVFAETTTVTVTGYGVNPESATQHAWKMAISQSVGTIVDSTVVVENDQLIKDEVLAFSKGFIDSFKVLETSSENGLVTVKIQAVVTTEQLASKLVEIGVHSIDVDGGSLGASLFSKMDFEKSCSEPVLELYRKVHDVWDVKVLGTPTIQSIESSYYMVVPLEVYVDDERYDELVDYAKRNISPIATDSYQAIYRLASQGIGSLNENPKGIIKGGTYYNLEKALNDYDETQRPLIVFKRNAVHKYSNPHSWGSTADVYIYPDKCFPEDVKYSGGYSDTDPAKVGVTISGLNSVGNVLFENTIPAISLPGWKSGWNKHLSEQTVTHMSEQSDISLNLFTRPSVEAWDNGFHYCIGYGSRTIIPDFDRNRSGRCYGYSQYYYNDSEHRLFDSHRFDLLIKVSSPEVKELLQKLDKLEVEAHRNYPEWYSKQ